jgi:hypothetical protein
MFTFGHCARRVPCAIADNEKWYREAYPQAAMAIRPEFTDPGKRISSDLGFSKLACHMRTSSFICAYRTGAHMSRGSSIRQLLLERE